MTKTKNRLYVALIIALPLLGMGVVHAAEVGMVTAYGTDGTGGTGGVVGLLNSAGDQANGRATCPNMNKYANPIPGCDMESGSGYNDEYAVYNLNRQNLI